MGWDRQPSAVVDAPAPPLRSRWLWAAVLAMFAGVLLFLLHASERVSLLHAFDIWLFSATPLLAWLLAFGARAYGHGKALSHQRFVEAQAHEAQQSWQHWAQRYMAVCASCVLLPDQVSAGALTQAPSALPRRTGQARRIAALTEGAGRARDGLQRLIQVAAPTLQALPAGQELRLTLLSDIDPVHDQPLRDAVHEVWCATVSRALPATLTLADQLSYRWIDETLKSASTAVELVLVLQVNGEQTYSDGLAMLLLCPDRLAVALNLPKTASLLRPMPLDINALDEEVPLLLRTQVRASEATGVLVADAEWQPLIGKLLAATGTQGAALKVEQQWVLEAFSGIPGPLGHWLLSALGVELARHLRQPMLALIRETSAQWVSTLTTGEAS